MKTFAFFGAVMLFGMAGCRDDEDTFYYNATTTCDVSEPPQDPPVVNNPDPVWQYNARFFGDATTRWNNGSIPVYWPDADVYQLSDLQALIDSINPTIAPACQLVISNWHGNWNGNWHHRQGILIEGNSPVGEFGGGVTERFPNDTFVISRTVIHLGAYYSSTHVLKRELIHSLGFNTFTYDGGVMDANVQDGEITPEVREFLERLYSMPPGTPVGPGAKG